MHRVRLLPIWLAFLVTGCLQSTTTMQNLAQNACKASVSGARVSSAASNLARSIAVPREQATLACSSARNYSCSRAVFSPDVADGRSVSQECADAGSLGTACLDVESKEFDTRAAIQAAALDPSVPGTYNHLEYSCFNVALKAGPTFPATALQYASLGEALLAAQKRCNEIAATLPSGR